MFIVLPMILQVKAAVRGHSNPSSSPARPFPRRTLVFALFALCASAAEAQTLSALLDVARQGEPSFQSARSNVDVALAKQRQSMGTFLPQLNLTANKQVNEREYKTLNETVPLAEDRYQSKSFQISASLPLWRYSDIASWKQAGAVVEQAERQLQGAEQDLSAKLAAAWFDLLAARDQQAFAEVQLKAARQGFDTARRGAELGVTSRPLLEETRAKLDQADADRIAADAEADAKRAALEQLAGTVPGGGLPFLRETLLATEGDEIPLDRWRQWAEEGNPALLAAQKAFDAAAAEVVKQYSGHSPTIELITSYSRNAQGAGSFPGQSGYDIKLGSLGVQVNVPLYSGGTQSAKVDEAIAQREKARHDIEAARRTAVLNVRQAWSGKQAARARLRAGQQAVQASSLSLRAARIGQRNGLKSELDVLQAEQQWLAARRDWGRAWYELMLSDLRLKATGGRLASADLAAVDSAFQPEIPAATVQGLPAKVIGDRHEG